MLQAETSDAPIATEASGIDQTVRSLHQQIAGLCRRRNELTSRFKCIPKEVAVEIFEACHSVTIASPEKNRIPHVVQTIRLVCWSWNELIKECPQLWTSIHVRDFEDVKLPSFNSWIAQHISSSQNGSLDLDVGYLSEKSNAGKVMKDILFPELHRWRSCSFELPSNDIGNYLADLRQPAPQLETFIMSCYSDTSNTTTILDLFSNNAPRLQHLEIPNLAIDWDSSLLRNLTKISILTWSGEKAPSGEQYCRLLLTCPELEQLKLVGPPNDNTSGIDFQVTAPLPRLKIFQLDSIPPLTARSLLLSIDTGSSKCAEVILQHQVGNPLQEFAGFRILSPIIQATHTARLGRENGWDFVLNSEVGSFYYSAATTNWACVVIDTISPGLRHSNLRDLFLYKADRYFDGPNALNNGDFFGDLANVKRLVPRETSEVFQELGNPWTIPDEPNSCGWLLPNLTKIDMRIDDEDYEILLKFLKDRHTKRKSKSRNYTYPAKLKGVTVWYSDYYDMKQFIKYHTQDKEGEVSDIVGYDALTWRNASEWEGIDFKDDSSQSNIGCSVGSNQSLDSLNTDTGSLTSESSSYYISN